MISETEQQNDTRVLWEFLQKKFRLILFTLLGGAAIATVFTFFIPKEYKSTGVVYPPSAPSAENSIDNPNFGYDVEADRLIQIFNSNEIRDSLTGKFKLYDYFEINRKDPGALDKLIREYRSNIHFERAPSMCVIVSAQTHDPVLSADMVNYLLEVTDKVRERLYKQNLKLSYDIALSDFKSQKHTADSMRNILTGELKENHLSGLLVLASNAQISIDMDKLAAKPGGESLSIGNDIITYRNMLERLKENETKLLRLKKILETPVPKLFVIDRAEPRYKKVSPSYSVNALTGAVVALALVLAFLVIGKSRHASPRT